MQCAGVWEAESIPFGEPRRQQQIIRRDVMTHEESAAHPEAEVERLLCALRGIVSARVVGDGRGGLAEVHILASDRLHPKQVVRNVESALSAGLGIVVDRRAVSVAQVRAGELSLPEPTVRRPAPAAVEDGPIEPPVELAEKRFVFVGHDVRNDATRETVCHVTIAREREHYTGKGRGASSPQGRAQAAARGLVAALATARAAEDLLFEHATVVEAHGRSYVLVSVQALVGRRTEPLTGVAWLQRSPEEAAVLAGLQAVNRWLADE